MPDHTESFVFSKDGKEYVAEQSAIACTGCAFYKDPTALEPCALLGHPEGRTVDCHNVIFKLKESTK